MNELLADIAKAIGEQHVLTGPETDGYAIDPTQQYKGHPLAVVRPANTAEVSAIVKLAAAAGTPIVPVSGNTGLCGGALAENALMISLARLNKLREIRPDARIAIVEAGMILSSLQDAADAHDLIFPLMFGARGSAMIGGALSTNAGGSNVVRYGNTRALCLGLEVVLPSGEILNLMSELHKDNSGYDLRDLFIGAEGTLGIITAAVVKLFPKPKAYATAMVAVPRIADALDLLNDLQAATGGGVEALEYLPANYIQRHREHFPDARDPLGERHDVNIMIEVGATSARDATQEPDGSIPIVRLLEETLEGMLESGAVIDAVVAQSEAQRAEMWQRRDSAAEITFDRLPIVNCDVAVPLDQVSVFIERMEPRLAALDAGADWLAIAHLGDGNLHYTAYPSRDDDALKSAITESVEELVAELRGSFSAEHGIGISKLESMSRRKDPVALAVMRQIKAALDPMGIMNPGKVIPD